MAVITISRQFGSGGDEIAELICKAANFHLFDKHMLAEMAQEAGLSEHEAVDYSEANYKVRTFLDRLLGRERALPPVRVWTEDKDGVRTKEEIWLNEAGALTLIQQAIRSAYRRDQMIIIGRGGQMVLQDQPKVLHVRIEAPREERVLWVRRWMQESGSPFADPVEARRAAQDLIDNRDAASADYLKAFYGVDWANTALYHLVLNTGKLSIETAAKIIIEAVKQIK
jgi:cytidylate kinase